MLDGIRVVVFDATGTLLTPSPPADQVYHRLGVELGSHQSPQQTRDRFVAALRTHFSTAAAAGFAGQPGGAAESSPHASLQRPQTSEVFERQRWTRIVADTLSDLSPEAIDNAFEILWRHFATPAAWSVYPDVAATLVGLRERGIVTAMGSNFDGRLISVVRGSAELESMQYVFSSAQLGYSKPDVRFFEAIAAELEMDASQILMVGDDPINDIQGARRAGWKAIQICRDPDAHCAPESIERLDQLVCG